MHMNTFIDERNCFLIQTFCLCLLLTTIPCISLQLLPLSFQTACPSFTGAFVATLALLWLCASGVGGLKHFLVLWTCAVQFIFDISFQPSPHYFLKRR